MNKLFSLIFGLGLVTSTASFSQCTGEVKTIFDKINEKATDNSAYQIDFELQTEYVGEPSSSQRGKLTVQDKKFRLSMRDQEYISDGTSLWIHLKSDKEIQIFDLDDNSEWASLSPIQLLQQYCSDDYFSRSLGVTLEDQKEVIHVEFSPNDKDQDIFKVRISYDDAKSEITRMKTFNKDGSRITLNADNYRFDISESASFFTLETSSFPDAHIEDMR